MEDKATWLFDLAHGNLDDDGIVKGFLKHYALQEQGLGDVQRDMHFHTHYGDYYLETAMRILRAALEAAIGGAGWRGEGRSDEGESKESPPG